MTTLLLDVVLAFDTRDDEQVNQYKPREKLWRRFRQIVGDEGYEAHCEFVGGLHRTVRGLLTPDEFALLCADLGLRWAGRMVDRYDDGYVEDCGLDLDQCLYFTQAALWGYTVAFVALPAGSAKLRDAVLERFAKNPRVREPSTDEEVGP